MMAAAREVYKLFIGGLTIETTEADIEQHFSRFGFVFDIFIIRNKESNLSKGYGFISCNNIKTYERILETEHHINGRLIDCHSSFKRLDDPDKFKENANKKIFVGGVSLETSDEDLSAYFSQFGPVRQAYVIKDPATRKSKKFGFAIMKTQEGVDKVLKQEIHIIRGVVASCKLFVKVENAEKKKQSAEERSQPLEEQILRINGDQKRILQPSMIGNLDHQILESPSNRFEDYDQTELDAFTINQTYSFGLNRGGHQPVHAEREQAAEWKEQIPYQKIQNSSISAGHLVGTLSCNKNFYFQTMNYQQAWPHYGSSPEEYYYKLFGYSNHSTNNEPLGQAPQQTYLFPDRALIHGPKSAFSELTQKGYDSARNEVWSSPIQGKRILHTQTNYGSAVWISSRRGEAREIESNADFQEYWTEIVVKLQTCNNLRFNIRKPTMTT